MRSILIIVVAAHLSGCGLAQQAQIQKDADVAVARREAGFQDCDRRYPDKRKKPITPRMQCLNDVVIEYAVAADRSVGNPFMDLVKLRNARVLAAADKFDKGQTSVAQLEVELAESDAEYTNQVTIRTNNAAMAGAAQQQAAAASQQAMTSAIRAATPPRPVACNTLGNSTTCY